MFFMVAHTGVSRVNDTEISPEPWQIKIKAACAFCTVKSGQNQEKNNNRSTNVKKTFGAPSAVIRPQGKGMHDPSKVRAAEAAGVFEKNRCCQTAFAKDCRACRSNIPKMRLPA